MKNKSGYIISGCFFVVVASFFSHFADAMEKTVGNQQGSRFDLYVQYKQQKKEYKALKKAKKWQQIRQEDKDLATGFAYSLMLSTFLATPITCYAHEGCINGILQTFLNMQNSVSTLLYENPTTVAGITISLFVCNLFFIYAKCVKGKKSCSSQYYPYYSYNPENDDE